MELTYQVNAFKRSDHMTIKLLDLEPQRRNAILNAALKEFALKGFDHASTNIIAKEAGLSKALMFHYVNNKQELFLCVYDYFDELLDKEYCMKMKDAEKDIFNKLRQSYLLQIELLKQYPWIFEFNRLSAETKSDVLNQELQKRSLKKQSSCGTSIFEIIDESKFRPGLDIASCKQLIRWATDGFTNEVLNDIRNLEYSVLDYELIVRRIDKHLEELRNIFY